MFVNFFDFDFFVFDTCLTNDFFDNDNENFNRTEFYENIIDKKTKFFEKN